MTAPRRPGAPRSSARSSSRPASDPQRRTRAAGPSSQAGSSRSQGGSPRSQRPGASRPANRASSGTSPSKPQASTAKGGSKGSAGKASAAPRIEAASAQGSWAAMLTWRTAVIVIVVISAFAVVTPTVRAYLDQQAMLNSLRADAATAQAEVDDLTAEVARWDDPAYVVAQARERLAYVFPGETPYRVVDPEVAADQQEDAAASEVDAAGTPLQPWYDTLWDSMVDAGGDDPAVEDAPAAEPATVDSTGTNEPVTTVDFGG
ncbi:septum formation initiator family protein [Demequina sp. B12]|uniref:FtsB family cell division protein n=1 Tax=Demequina sp. B12 TaxID=2992757 RepID=UPI00237AB105|nr:septum formation initiator family protein [Demequina sp. B12]MDE0573781.1 septum formation initiator family protein [Demequina sp. B12]